MTEKISPSAVRDKQDRGEDVIMVCAYLDDEICRKADIEGAWPYSQLLARLPTIAKSREIVFFCDCENDETSMERSREFRDRGYINVKALEGGVKAWHKSAISTSMPHRV
jgi:rhodanese-related sulfurtransferase